MWPALFLVSGLLTPIQIRYPARDTIFPPRITAPTFLWRDAAPAAHWWRIEIDFPDGSPALRTTAKGERSRVGPIDPDCIASTNSLPAASDDRTWIPDSDLWRAIQRHASAGVTR